MSSPSRRFGLLHGALLVAASASLWGTDALFRQGLAEQLPAIEVVFWEHLILAAVVLPFVLRSIGALRGVSGRAWIALAVVGGGSSVAATILFTQALTYGNPTLPLLLQKLQPVIAVAAARVLLGERLLPRYFVYFVASLAGSYLIAFGTHTNEAGQLAAAGLAVGAAALWALGTVLGKYAGAQVTPMQLTSLRFVLGFPVALVLLLIHDAAEGGPLVHAQGSDAPALIELALIPGLLALVLYYRGLRRTTASAATLAELAFPLTAVVVNYFAFGTTLDAAQIVGAVLLSATVVTLGLADRRGGARSGVVPPRRSMAMVPEPEPG
jgi:drug/metabolite transporter (DMT)-like permease